MKSDPAVGIKKAGRCGKNPCLLAFQSSKKIFSDTKIISENIRESKVINCT